MFLYVSGAPGLLSSVAMRQIASADLDKCEAEQGLGMRQLTRQRLGIVCRRDGCGAEIENAAIGNAAIGSRR